MGYKISKRPDFQKRLKVLLSGNFRQFLEPAGQIVVDDIISNIKSQVDYNGSPLKRNTIATQKAKISAGWGNKSLIAEFRLLISKGTYTFQYFPDRIRISLAEVRKAIGGYVEAKGYLFFDIGNKAKLAVHKKWRSIIENGLR